MDQDYIDQLKNDPANLEWLSKFNNEYYGNSFVLTDKAKKKRLKKKKNGSKRRTKRQIKLEGNIYSPSKNLHSPKLISENIDEFNTRQRDIYNQRLKSGLASDSYSDNLGNSLVDEDCYGSEDAILDYIDAKREIEKKMDFNIRNDKYEK